MQYYIWKITVTVDIKILMNEFISYQIRFMLICLFTTMNSRCSIQFNAIPFNILNTNNVWWVYANCFVANTQMWKWSKDLELIDYRNLLWSCFRFVWYAPILLFVVKIRTMIVSIRFMETFSELWVNLESTSNWWRYQ